MLEEFYSSGFRANAGLTGTYIIVIILKKPQVRILCDWLEVPKVIVELE